MSEKSTFYLVREEILPEAIKKTIKVKEILKRGEIKTINCFVDSFDFTAFKDFFNAVKSKLSTKQLKKWA